MTLPKKLKLNTLINCAALSVLICVSTLGHANLMEKIVTLDDQFAAVAKLDKSFAGIYVRDNTLVIRHSSSDSKLDKKQKNKLYAAVTTVFSHEALAQIASKRVYESANYPVTDLVKWQHRSINMLNESNVIFSDLDEVQNTLVFGITADSNQKYILDKIKKFGVPLDAVKLNITQPFVQQANLRDRIRPVVGGVQLKFGPFRCTAGIPIRLSDNSHALITNSHCTDNQGGVEGTVYKQPNNGLFGANRISTEISDPIYTQTSSLCPSNRLCRFSDSSVIEMDQGVSVSRGRLARAGSWGSRVISSVDPDYEITQSALFILSGQVVTKIGRTTGKTGGQIINTCITTDVANTNITQLCQYRVGSAANIGGGVAPFSAPGDSGSPVFQLLPTPNSTHNVRLYGLHWGGNGSTSVFSPFTSVFLELQQEIGSFQFIR